MYSHIFFGVCGQPSLSGVIRREIYINKRKKYTRKFAHRTRVVPLARTIICMYDYH